LANIKVLVWREREPPEGSMPEVEATIPASLARFVPRFMTLIPRKAREETWGADADFSVLGDLEKIVGEMAEGGTKEVMDVKTKDSRIKVLVEG